MAREMGSGVVACANILQSTFAGTGIDARERLLDRIGDVSELLRDCAANGKLHDTPILVFDLGVTFRDLAPREVPRIVWNRPPRAGFRSEMLGPPVWFDEDENPLELTQPVEEFAQRLVQNALWANGHYVNRLDGIIGNVSLEALKKAIGDAEIGARGPVSSAGRNYIALWLPELADVLLAPSAPVRSDEAQFRAVMTAQPETAGTAETQPFFASLFDGIKRLFQEAVEFGRSVMVGAGNLLRRIGDAITKGVRGGCGRDRKYRRPYQEPGPADLSRRARGRHGNRPRSGPHPPFPVRPPDRLAPGQWRGLCDHPIPDRPGRQAMVCSQRFAWRDRKPQRSLLATVTHLHRHGPSGRSVRQDRHHRRLRPARLGSSARCLSQGLSRIWCHRGIETEGPYGPFQISGS